MFLHIGGDVAIPVEDLIAIINLEIGVKKEATREFLSYAEDEKTVIRIGDKEHNKSIVLTRSAIYYSPISTATLLKRAENRELPGLIY